jgi:hypothetical protein
MERLQALSADMQPTLRKYDIQMAYLDADIVMGHTNYGKDLKIRNVPFKKTGGEPKQRRSKQVDAR